MNTGNLSHYFEAAGAKRLSAVDIDPERSNQHEFACPAVIADAYGRPVERIQEPADYIYLCDEEDAVVASAGVSIYDARSKDPKRSAEFRLYYPDNDAVSRAVEGDLLIVAKHALGNRLAVILAKDGSTAGIQLLHLFGLVAPVGSRFDTSDETALRSESLDFTRKSILEDLGIAVAPDGDQWLDEMRSTFGETLPPTAEFSEFARSTVSDVEIGDGPDALLLAWMNREQDLFNSFDAFILGSKLDAIIEAYTAGNRDAAQLEELFLSRQNQRKSRAGHALENHLAEIFNRLEIGYVRNYVTENNSKPDFLFPDGGAYDDPNFPSKNLTMLGAKRTVKDRWRQVLAEADRIAEKHLCTLQAPISTNQTDEMQSKGLTLVIPSELHSLFLPEQASQILSLAEFAELVQSRAV